MGEDSCVDKLFFELASESRLSILRLLQKETLKMQEIARRLNVTATEVFRQLERLSTAGLVKRQPDGAFTISDYGKLVLQASSTLDFISTHRDYFSSHNVMLLPAQFVNRLGELSGAKLSLDTIANLNRAEQAYVKAKSFGFGIAEGTIPEHMAPKMEQKMLEGLKFKFLVPQNRLPKPEEPIKTANVGICGITELPLILVLTEEFGCVCFLQSDGKVDYSGFFWDDATFLGWVRDVFNYYWDKATKSKG
ncbi:MAG: helix-turn-helix transcriptional regulator [Candidatus Bathyarchaeia archaeon]